MVKSVTGRIKVSNYPDSFHDGSVFQRHTSPVAGTTLAKPPWADAMTRAPATELIRRAIFRHGFDNVSDATLLVRYTRHADSDAFAELVHRYAGLVWGTCRRNCPDEHTAEDAFQATFGALARQARSLRRPEFLPGWLHGVARRSAWKLRKSARCNELCPVLD